MEFSIPSDGPIIEDKPDNALELDVTGIIGSESTLIEGSGLWKVGVFASRSQNGAGQKLGYQEQVLSDAMQGQPLEPPANLAFGQMPVNFDMRGISCSDAQYLCTKLSKNDNPMPEYTFKADPSDRVLTRCIDIRDRCVGKDCHGYFMLMPAWHFSVRFFHNGPFQAGLKFLG